MALDAPGAVGLVEREGRHRGVAAIDERGHPGDPDEAAPGAGADERAEPRFAEEPGEHVAAAAREAVDEHRLGAGMAVGRPGPVLAVAAGPVVGDRAVQQFDEARGDLPAAVPALVDHEPRQVRLPVELPHQVALPVDAGVGHVDVADLPIGRLGDAAAVLLDPIAVAQVRLAREQFDDHLAGVVAGHGAIGERERHRLAGETCECRPRRGVEIDRHAVHREQEVALLRVDARHREGVAGVGVPVGAAVDPGDPVAFVPLAVDRPLEVDAEHAHRSARLRLAIAAPVVGVAHVQLGDHLPDDERDVLAGRGVVDERQVLLEHCRPVDAVHRGVVEEVALHPPRVADDLPPLLAGGDLDEHRLDDDAGAARVDGRREDRGVRAALRHEDLRAFRRDQEAAAGGDALLAAGRIGGIEEADPAALAAAHVEQVAGVVDLEVAEAARGNRQLHGAALEADEIDAKPRRLAGVVLGRLEAGGGEGERPPLAVAAAARERVALERRVEGALHGVEIGEGQHEPTGGLVEAAREGRRLGGARRHEGPADASLRGHMQVEGEGEGGLGALGGVPVAVGRLAREATGRRRDRRAGRGVVGRPVLRRRWRRRLGPDLDLVARGQPGVLDVLAQRHREQHRAVAVDPGGVEFAVGGAEDPLAREVEPIAAAVEDRVEVVEHAAGDHMAAVLLEVVEHDLAAASLPRRHRVGEPAAVVAPADPGGRVPGVAVDLAGLATLDLDEAEAAVLVGDEQAGRIGRPGEAHPIGAAGTRQRPRLAAPIGGDQHRLVLAARVARGGDPAPIGAPGGHAFGGTAGAGEVAGRALLGGQRPDVAPRRDHRAAPVGPEVPVLDLRRGVDDARPQGAAVAGHGDLDRARGAGLLLPDEDPRAVLEDDPRRRTVVWADRGPLHVVVAERGHLPPRAAVEVVRPEIQAMVLVGALVGEVVHGAPVPHWKGVLALPVGDLAALAGLEVEQPDVRRHAAAVALPGAAIDRVGREREPAPIRRERAVGAIGHRQRLGQAAASRHAEDPRRSRHAAHAACCEEQVAIGGPVGEHLGGGVVGHPQGHAAIDADHMDVAVAVVVADEGDPRAAGREAGHEFGAGRARERPRFAALDRHRPEIVREDEDDPVVGDVRVAEHRRLVGDRRQRERQGRQQGGRGRRGDSSRMRLMHR